MWRPIRQKTFTRGERTVGRHITKCATEIDEFGLDRIERSLCPQAASLWYKVIDARNQRVSTALVTNIDFEKWDEYLGDHYLAMAMLDRLVDGAIIVKLKGKSYRVHRGGDQPIVE